MSDTSHNRSRIVFWIVLVLFAGLTYLARQHVFFWDTVQFAGKHGLWFYEQNFRSLLLPPEIDSGHPPVFGWYLALVWKLLGKSLAVSHWAMFPFLAGIVWQLYSMGKRLLKNIPVFWLVLIPLADPVFLGQSVLVSPDVVLVFFFLLAVSAFREGRQSQLGLAYLGMSLISLRGMMITAAFALVTAWGWLQTRRKRDQFVAPKWILTFLPAGLLSLAFLWVHYSHTGWVGYHSDSPWAPSFDRIGTAGLLRNFIIWCWRWLDMGRVFIWVSLIFILILDRIKTGRTLRTYYLRLKTSSYSGFFRLFLSISLLLSYSFLTYRGLQAHRYLLPCFLLFSILTVLIIDRFPFSRIRKFLLPLLFLGLLSGNLWKYPDDMAQGWDSTLAHWPYYQLRKKTLTYLDEQGIPPEEVGTAFPEIGPFGPHDLSGREVGFREKDLTRDKWIFYSNIMNDFSDAELKDLQQNWVEKLRLESWPVKVILFERVR
ncbi:MAG: glycosyltransferase family 39 protein [Saprospiraceae bacterium]|nr:glycosyltransferase family 39 protein [Lewinella sp.]